MKILRRRFLYLAAGAAVLPAVSRISSDGYTLLLMEPGAVLAKWLNKTVPFDVSSDFSPIAMVATSRLVLFAHPSVAFRDVKELITYSKANPRKLSVGTPGVGTPHHLAAAWLNTAAKIDITHVPYRGAAPALNDLLGGQIPLIWASPVAVLQYVEQGKVRMLGVSTQQRHRMLPQVPTISESGVPGFDTENWFGVAAPAPRCRRKSSLASARPFVRPPIFPIFRGACRCLDSISISATATNFAN
jgi:tripartite-type tricarboxylate transporter receptor subunit TctC